MADMKQWSMHSYTISVSWSQTLSSDCQAVNISDLDLFNRCHSTLLYNNQIGITNGLNVDFMSFLKCLRWHHTGKTEISISHHNNVE